MKVSLIGKPDFAGEIAKLVSNSKFIEVEERIFPDGEVCPRLLLSNENQLQNNHAIIVMQLELDQPKNRYLISLLWTIYNIKGYNPAKISCIMPYHLYSRQDRESRVGEPISSKYLASTLESAGIDNFLTINSHTYGKIDIKQFFFNSHASDLSAIPTLGSALRSQLTSPQEVICLAPDEGALFLAKELAESIGTPLYTAVQKHRDPDTGEISQKLSGLPFEIVNRSVVIIDDMVSSGKTMMGAGKIALDKGAKDVSYAYVHGVHSPNSFLTILNTKPNLIITTDTIKKNIDGLTTVSVIPIISSWIKEHS